MKKRTTVIGTAALAALLLSGCSATDKASEASPSASESTASVTINDEVKAELASLKLDDQFDFSKAVPLSVGNGTFQGSLNDGVLFTGDSKVAFYGQDGKLVWESEAKGATDVIQWEGKQYPVVISNERKEASSSGLEKTQDEVTDLVKVLDPETGKLIHEHKTNRSMSVGDGGWEAPESQATTILYRQKAVVGTNSSPQDSVFKTVNPLTGEDLDQVKLAEPTKGYPKVVQSFAGVTKAGKIATITETDGITSQSDDRFMTVPGIAPIKSPFVTWVNEQFAFTTVETGNSDSGARLVNIETGKEVAKLDSCGTTTLSKTIKSISPDGTVIAFADEAVDTKTGKVICILETKDKKGLNAERVDNNGNVYGASGSYGGTGSFVLNLTSGKSQESGTPDGVTSDGGLFKIKAEGDSAPDYVLAPAKK